MPKISINEIAERVGYGYSTVKTLLCRSEFAKYYNRDGHLVKWDTTAEDKLNYLIEKKNKGRKVNVNER